MLYFTADAIDRIHEYAIEYLGGQSGPLNRGNVEAAAERPRTKVYHTEPFESLCAKASALGYSLNKWHGYLDGNKRTALLSMILMLQMNGAHLTVPPYMTKYLLLVAEDKMPDEEWETAIKRFSSGNRVSAAWKDFRYSRWPVFRYTALHRIPFTRRYAEGLELDWLAAGDRKALKIFKEEYEKWEELGYPKDDVELKLPQELADAINQGFVVRE